MKRLNGVLLNIGCIAALVTGMGVTSVWAQDSERVFLPTSAWLVGPASLQALASKEQLPCVMANQFDNGYHIRISGTDESIMAMAVDFRKQLFDSGESYDLKIKAGEYSASVKGMAHDATTLIINTDNSKSLYRAMGTAENLDITFGSTALPFSLAGAREGIGRLSSCYNNATARADTDAKDQVNETGRQKKAVETDVMLSGDAGAPIAEQAGKQDNQEDQAHTGNKNPANSFASVPDMTGEQQDDNNDVADMVGGFLKKAQNAKPEIMDDVIATKSFPDEAPVRQTSPKVDDGIFQWQAKQGADLKQVLNIWTSHRDIGLLWGVDESYVLPRTFFYEGPIKDAVAALLNEFEDVSQRPVSRIYHDEQKDRTVLLIQSASRE